MNFKRHSYSVATALAAGMLITLGAGPSTHFSVVKAATVNATAGGEVSGTVKFVGPAPQLARIKMAAEPSCQKQHPSGATAEDVEVGPDGGLENVVVYVSSGLPADDKFDPPKNSSTLEQKGCMYQPHVLAMQAGQPLEIVNDDQTTHNIHPQPQNNREWNKAQPPGTPPVEESFTRQEISIPVKCNVHPWMKSYIAVFKHPYFAVTGRNGSFDIKGLPPGTYTVQAWHEKLGTLSQQVTISQNSKPLEFDFKSH